MVYLTLVQNAALLVTLAASHQIILRRFRQNTLWYTGLSGILFGAICIVGMKTPVQFADGVIYDGRSVILAVAALFGGPAVGIIAGIAAAVFRIWIIGGDGAMVGTYVIIESVVLGIALRYLRRRNDLWSKPLLLWVFGVVLHLGMLALQLALPAGNGLTVIAEVGPAVMTVHPLAFMLISLMFIDSERRVQAQFTLQEDEERYRTLFEDNHLAMLLLEAESGRIVDANPAAAELYNWSREALLTMSIRDLKAEPDEQAGNHIDDILAEQIDHFVSLHRRADGSTREVQVNTCRIRTSGRSLVYAIIVDITVSAKAIRSLRESEERFRSLVERAPDAIFIQTKGRFAFVNPAAVTLFGATQDGDLIGRSIIEQFHPGCREQIRERIRTLNHDGQSVPLLDEEILRLDGTPVPVEASAIPFHYEGENGALVFVRDVTKRTTAQRALEASRRQMAALLESSPLAIVTLDRDGIVQSWNPAAERLLGWTPEEAIGSFLPTITEDTRAESLNKIEHVFSGNLINSRELYRRRKDGSEILLRISAAPVKDAQGGVISMVMVADDITQQKNLEEQLNQARKMEAIGQLAGGVAHDFNNLLQVINGQTEIGKLEIGPNHPAQEMLDEVLKAGERAASLTRQLLAFSRRQVMRPETLDLNAVIGDILKMLGRLLGEHILIEFLPGSRLGSIHADRGMMEQVILNLAINARDAMPRGGRLVIETENVRINGEYSTTHVWASPGHYVLLSFTDTGTGMDATTLQHIYEPFFTTKGKGKGTGLGLATVYGIVQQHDGMINAYSELNRGTTFKVYLPLCERPAESVGSKIIGPPPVGSETILLAEDDEAVRHLAGSILQKAGYTVLFACDGLEALEVFRKNQDRIEMLLLDVVMPEMGGRSLYDEIIKSHPGIPALFTSGYSENAVHTNFVLHEGLDLLQKPYAPEALLHAVRRVLDKKQG